VIALLPDGHTIITPLAGLTEAQSLAALQGAVGGFIEHGGFITLLKFPGVRIDVWVDEDGRAKQLPPNVYASALLAATQGGRLPRWIGPVVLTHSDSTGVTMDLPPEVETYLAHLHQRVVNALQGAERELTQLITGEAG
jgi:hypothetical protein